MVTEESNGREPDGETRPVSTKESENRFGSFILPSEKEQIKECQSMNLITLREVFANRGKMTRKEARDASNVFRGVSGQLRSIEGGR
jgi:hypothetical protein